MNIQYGNKNWEVNLYFVIILLVLFNDRLFLDFFIDPEQPSAGTSNVLTAIAILSSIFIFPKLDRFLKIWLLLTYIFLGFLALESYYTYRTFFVYPHVFSRITGVFIVPFIYIFFRDNKKEYVKNIVYFIVFVFIIHLIFIKPYVFSFASFMNQERGVPASSLLLLALPAIFLFNTYMVNNKMFTLFLLLIVLLLILFLQHRSVWMATLTAFIINIILVKKKGDFKIQFSSIAFIFLVPFIFSLIFSSLILSKNPEVVEKFIERVEDIKKVDQQGTGNWRLKQAESYWPFIRENIAFGMRFAGFELPIQFYEESSGNIYFEDRTGHHFHSFYVDVLFYLGLLGLFLKIAPIIYVIKLGFNKRSLTIPQISLISVVGSLVVYGLAYNIPFYMYAFTGIALAHLIPKTDNDLQTRIEDISEQKTLVSK